MDSISEKRCRRCRQYKDRKLFGSHRGKKDGLNAICLECHRAQMKEWRAKNPERTKEIAREMYYKDIDKTKAKAKIYRSIEKIRLYHYEYRIKSKYGIDLEEYKRLFEKQGGKCAVCEQVSKKRLQVDHDHKTGKVRGLLCGNCNTALGKLGDEASMIDRLKRYFGVD